MFTGLPVKLFMLWNITTFCKSKIRADGDELQSDLYTGLPRHLQIPLNPVSVAFLLHLGGVGKTLVTSNLSVSSFHRYWRACMFVGFWTHKPPAIYKFTILKLRNDPKLHTYCAPRFSKILVGGVVQEQFITFHCVLP